MKYVVNGKTFDDLKEAEEYENELTNKNAVKEKRYNEMVAAYDRYQSLLEAYREDYPEDYRVSNYNSFCEALYDILNDYIN